MKHQPVAFQGFAKMKILTQTVNGLAVEWRQWFLSGNGSEIVSPVVRAMVATTVLAMAIMFNKYLAGAIAVAFDAALVGSLNLFGIVVECAFDFIHQLVAEVKASIDQACLYLFKADHKEFIMDAQGLFRGGMYLNDACDIGKAQCRSLYLVRVWVSRIEGEFAHFEIVFFILHSHMLSKIPHLASGF